MTPLEYSLIRFTPSPEDIEAVNVAIMLWGPPPQLLFHDLGFPRLGSITDRFDERMLRIVLEDFPERFVASGGNPAGLSAQIQVSGRQRLFSPLTDDVAARLVHRYLASHRRSSRRGSRLQRQAQENALDRFLLTSARVPEAAVASRQPVENVLPNDLRRKYFPSDGVVFARTIRGPHDLVFLDSLHLDVALTSLEHRANTIGVAFSGLDRAKAELEDRIQRRVQRAVIHFGELDQRQQPRLDFIHGNLLNVSEFWEDELHPSAGFLDAVQRNVPMALA